MAKTKYKSRDRILYKHRDDNFHHTATVLSIDGEDNYWLEWDSDSKDNNWITQNPISDIDNDPGVMPLTPTTLILYGANNND